MALRHSARTVLGCGVALAAYMGIHSVAAQQTALGINTARITVAGTSNIHEYTASTTAVRVTRVELANGVAGTTFWDDIVKPGALEAFDIAIPAAKLTSPKEGLDKNMHKALKVQEHPEITFRLARLEPGAGGALKAVGMLRIAGVEREVAMKLTTQRTEAGLVVKGELPLLMTDYGITPPKAMLGMLKTDPKVTVTFETVLGVPLT
jgi:polyisoprenoid-binding protein YceI